MKAKAKFEIFKGEGKRLECGTMVYRIYAMKDFRAMGGMKVVKGTRGGWVESESNLSQDGFCWIADEACVFGNAQVSGDAIVYEKARVCDDAAIYGNAMVYGHALICGKAEVCRHAEVFDGAVVRDDAGIFDDAKVCGNAVVDGETTVCGKTVVDDMMVFDGDDEKPLDGGMDYFRNKVIIGGCGFEFAKNDDDE